MKIKKSYEDFLADIDFEAWMLTGDDHLDVYWEEYIELHPEEKDEFEKAIQKFSSLRLNKSSLSEQEYAQLLQRIQRSSFSIRRTKRIRLICQYAAVACIALIAGFSIYHYTQTKTEEFDILSENLIVGENMDAENIRLITDTGTSSFSKDVRVHIDEDGSTTIEEEGEGAKQIETGSSTMAKLVVPYGKRSELTLSDGTRVWVNSGSVLEFPSVFKGKTRKVSLSGEMYLEVAKDSQTPFIVQTSDLQIKVYGTKFNVNAYQDNSSQSVVLVEGSVGVKSASDKETLLVANEMFTYSDRQWDKKAVDVSQYVSWKEGYIILNSTPMSEVLKYVERYYNLTFNIPDHHQLEQHRCTGKIYLSNDLDNVMETVSLLSSTRYKREDKTIYIDINP